MYIHIQNPAPWKCRLWWTIAITGWFKLRGSDRCDECRYMQWRRINDSMQRPNNQVARATFTGCEESMTTAMNRLWWPSYTGVIMMEATQYAMSSLHRKLHHRSTMAGSDFDEALNTAEKFTFAMNNAKVNTISQPFAVLISVRLTYCNS